jgi:carboxyl-terminal processing protease
MNNGLRTLTTVMVTGFMAVAVFAGGFVAGHYTALPDSPVFTLAGLRDLAGSTEAEPDDRDALFAPFWETWDLVHQQYVDQPVDDVALMQGAIAGMLEALGDDPTRYMAPQEFEIISSDQSGELQGIGAYVEGVEDGGLRIISPFPGSPAEAAGLLPGDLIIEVDGTDVRDLSEYEIIDLVRGPAGSAVRLLVEREGDAEPQEFTVTRAKIVIPSIESEMLAGQVGYVKINDFGSRTLSELQEALRTLKDDGATSLIVDLRGNPGGYRNTAVDVASQFLPRGTLVMREQYADGHEVTYKAKGGGLATDLPLVVLINAGSASASEIVAGAISDHDRGTLLGEVSFGKGTVQTWHTLRGDNGAVSVTIARWLTPDGGWIQGEGITPDVEVEVSEADQGDGLDPQLQAALELLQTGEAVPAP